MTKYIVIEIQKAADGTMSNLSYSYNTLHEAESKYHLILSAAATSNVAIHSCILISEEGFPLRHECYKHDSE